MKFEEAVEFVLAYEGGYVNDPNDPGGETNFGISKRAYPNVDIKNLTREDVIDIYRRDYWDRCRCGELPSGVDLDGVIGPITLAAANTKRGVLTEFIGQRAFHYAQIPQVLHYGLGWYRRLAAAAELGFNEEAA